MSGKTILLTSEQGLGDDIMFIRYARELKKRWPTCKVWFRGGILLRNLFKGVDGLDRFILGDEKPPDDYDYHCSMLSLPHRFGTTLETIPDETPYISPVEGWEEWELPLKGTSIRRIGLCWAGSPRHGKDAWRSLPPESFQSMIDTHCEKQFYSLQVGPRADECARLTNIIDLAPSITDFTDTAQAILQLDLVVTCDSAVGHLAGALEKPVWICLPHSPDWRWRLETEKSEWYPTARLFRQEKTGEWEPVLKRINEAL